MWQKKHRLLNKGMAILLGGALVFGCVPQTGVLVSKAAETEIGRASCRERVSKSV